MKQIKIGQEFLYKNIDKENFDEFEYGGSCVGEAFLVFKHQQYDKTVSFVLTGSTGNGDSIYRCVYSDFQPTL